MLHVCFCFGKGEGEGGKKAGSSMRSRERGFHLRRTNIESCFVEQTGSMSMRVRF